MARAAYGPGRGRAAHPACAPDGSPEPGPRAGNGRTAAPDQPPTDPSSPDPIAIDLTATESRLRQAYNTLFQQLQPSTDMGCLHLRLERRESVGPPPINRVRRQDLALGPFMRAEGFTPSEI